MASASSPTRPDDRPGVSLLVTQERCSFQCSEAFLRAPVRPFLVEVCVNEAGRLALFELTGGVTEDCTVCTNPRCGGLFQALKALAPLQELVK